MMNVKGDRGEVDHDSYDGGSISIRDEEAGILGNSFDGLRDDEDKERLLSGDENGCHSGERVDDVDDQVVKVRIDWEWVSSQTLAFWTSYRSAIWVILMIWANSSARGLFTGDFPFPLYFMFVLQILSNGIFEIWAIYKIIHGYRETGLQGKEWSFNLTLLQAVLHIFRLLICSVLSSFSMLIGAHALVVYQNFNVIAILPIFSYCCDSVLLHLASICGLYPRQTLIIYLNFVVVLTILGMLPIIVFTDYRVEENPLRLALGSIALESLSRMILTIRSDGVSEQRRESSGFIIFEGLLTGISQFIITSIVAFKLEDVVLASHRMDSWGRFGTFWIALPAVLLLLLFGNGFNSVHRQRYSDEVTSLLEDGKPRSKEVVAATLHAALCAMVFRYFKEQTLLNWFQSIAFAVLYVVALGPFVVGHYPQKFYNTVARILHRKQRHNPLQSWSLLVYLLIATFGVSILLACSTIYISNTIAFTHSARQFINPSKPNLDYAYRPPRIRGLDIIVVHSNGHPHQALYTQIETIKTSRKILNLGPTLRIITKDNTLVKKSSDQQVRDNHIETLPDIGGPAASILHYILTSWDTLPVQVVFFSSPAKEGDFKRLYMTRIYEHFAGQGFPIADAEPKTGFLNLGGQRVCDCHDCRDELGWEDTFDLVPSMYAAAHPNTTTACNKVVLTYGNHFFASAARIRGMGKDLWQMLYDGLMENNTETSWVHERKKLPQRLNGEGAIGRWAKDGVYGVKDSLQDPLLGRTIERLWGVLMQCSTANLAWHCPGLERGWRLNGEMADCGCIDDLFPGFL